VTLHRSLTGSQAFHAYGMATPSRGACAPTSACYRDVRMRFPDPSFWHNKRVLVTGHLGFKGGWLCAWLSRMGALVHGIDNRTDPSASLVSLAKVPVRASHSVDVTHQHAVLDVFHSAAPEIVVHMAALPIVRTSYAYPAETFRANVQGTVN